MHALDGNLLSEGPKLRICIPADLQTHVHSEALFLAQILMNIHNLALLVGLIYYQLSVNMAETSRSFPCYKQRVSLLRSSSLPPYTDKVSSDDTRKWFDWLRPS